MDRSIDDAADAVEAICAPDKMSKEQAVDFLEGVIERLRSSIEALKEEMED